MSVTMEFDEYTDICAATTYGREFLNLSSESQRGLNDYMDGLELSMSHGYNPDNLWVNCYVSVDDRELLVDKLSLLTQDQFTELSENDGLVDWINDHADDIYQHDEVVILGRGYDSWDVLLF